MLSMYCIIAKYTVNKKSLPFNWGKYIFSTVLSRQKRIPHATFFPLKGRVTFWQIHLLALACSAGLAVASYLQTVRKQINELPQIIELFP